MDMKDRDLFSAKRYPGDVRLKAMAAVDMRRLKKPTDRTIFREVAEEFGIGEQSLRLWVKKHDADSRKGAVEELPRDDTAPRDDELAAATLEAEVRTLRRKVEKLQAENDVLKRAFVVFSSEWEK
ncbi:hypothetical protein [Agrobacterium larrymoorei]|uniref:Transposase n=1 Tax=Agrobacterium larrymoorei TaxID=160699 RepID=A0A4D7E1J1_9HYPH|nr:hypothetical protein [Agrobacterium larrymoorei]QCJ01170.1 hypothetical protein CFBP5473_24865 [Agrobacterium larrymoorei]QYA10180.1 hypothetical protein J5285_23515 [Agrobacterium larrymoorei]